MVHAFLQALIMCQRYADAQAAASKLLPGVDKLYLGAEASWRAAAMPQALTALHEALGISADSQKCLERLHFLRPIQQLDASSLAAFETGESSRVVQACCRSAWKSEACSSV